MRAVRAATDTLVELAVLYVLMLLAFASMFALAEGLSWLTSLYWAGTTATSTGYGDVIPKTSTGKVLSFIVMHIGVYLFAPLAGARLTARLVENHDAFTHAEQVEMIELLRQIRERV